MESVQHVVVAPGEPIGVINPYLHGQFAEHLGELVYPGICVEPDCGIPNTHGIRDDVVAALKPLGVPVLRWPGGCFADDYRWRDGIGPIERRPLRLNRHWGLALEPNRFGTHEFVAFCRAIGAEPYFAANLGSGTPADLRDWAEYCNHGGPSALADERRANGAEEPFGVRLWGIGNENWACGGDMSPERYAEEFCRFRSYLSAYSGTAPQAIACGPNGPDWAWTRRFLRHMREHYGNRLGAVQGFAAHYYCGTAGTATEFTEAQWLELLAKARAVEGVIVGTRSIVDEVDPERRVRLLLDEWGTWHPVEAGKPAGGLYQQSTMRDACVAALSLDLFHNHADKLYMANIAQLINVLQALLLVDGDRCLRTPTYHVFDLYRAHRGGQAVRFESLAEAVSDGGEAAEHCRRCYPAGSAPPLRAVHGSASVLGGALCLTAVNTHPSCAIELEVALVGAAWDEVEYVALAADDIRAHNTFDAPDRVRLSARRSLPVGPGGPLRVAMDPASVVRLRGRLR